MFQIVVVVLCCIVCVLFNCSLSVKIVSHHTVDARLFLRPRYAPRGEQAAAAVWLIPRVLYLGKICLVTVVAALII